MAEASCAHCTSSMETLAYPDSCKECPPLASPASRRLPARCWAGRAQRHSCTTARSSTDTELLDPSDFENKSISLAALRGRAVEPPVISHPNFSGSHDLTHRRRGVDAAYLLQNNTQRCSAKLHND